MLIVVFAWWRKPSILNGTFLGFFNRHERKSISAVVQIIAAKKSLFAVPKDAVWDIYTELLRVEEELSNLHKDKQWER